MAFFGLKKYHVINLSKCIIFPICFTWMLYFNNFSLTALIYTGLHSSYAILWLLKHFTFPDSSWETDLADFSEFVVYFVVLMVFYDGFLPYLCISNTNNASNLLLFECIVLFVMGTNIMLISDAQKYFCLKYNKGKLINYGMWKYIRQPNYIGEMMTYGSLLLLTRSWISIIILICQWWGLFFPNMRRIDKSLSRYPEWKQYKKNSFSFVDYI